MGIVTAIEPQKRKKNRFNLHVDQEFVLAINDEMLAETNLKVGDQVTEEEIKKLVEKVSVGELLNKVYKFLAFRPRTEKEIRIYLSKKRVGKTAINLVVDRLRDQGYLDDRGFAYWWVEQRSVFRPKGKHILKRELLSKGLAADVIEEVLETHVNDFDLALKVAQRSYPKYKTLSQREFTIKMGQFLARRGFSWEVVREVIDRIKPR